MVHVFIYSTCHRVQGVEKSQPPQWVYVDLQIVMKGFTEKGLITCSIIVMLRQIHKRVPRLKFIHDKAIFKDNFTE